MDLAIFLVEFTTQSRYIAPHGMYVRITREYAKTLVCCIHYLKKKSGVYIVTCNIPRAVCLKNLYICTQTFIRTGCFVQYHYFFQNRLYITHQIKN